MATRPLTDQERAEKNPPFNDSRRTAMATAAPPFAFEHAMLLYFPVRADLAQLENFVDRYLNQAVDFAYFRPAMPFVLLMVNFYPKMGMASGDLGTVSQNEVLFTVPLEWYEQTDNGPRFKGMAQFSPYAFVDKDASQIEGREVYGWPKVEGWFTSEVSEWAEDPRGRRNILAVDTHGFRQLYDGHYDATLPFVRISQEAPLSFTVTPPEFGGPLDPAWSIPRTMTEWSQLMMHCMDWAQSNMSRLMAGGSPDLADLIANAPDAIASLTNTMVGNTVNFKQIRDAADPSVACYQAITNAAMEITRIHRGGMLGDMALLRGDYSGGYEILLHCYPSMPIVESLGLEVEPVGDDQVRLQPVLPFWQELDLKYLTGENLAWRAWSGGPSPWRDSEKVEILEGQAIDARPEYMKAAGAGFQVAEGPFRLPGATMEVLPLLADKQALTDFLQHGMGDTDLASESLQPLPADWVPQSLMGQLPRDLCYFEPWGSYVYMVISHFPEMSSETNDFGSVSEDNVMFVVPVLLCHGEDHSREVLSAGFVTPFAYSNNAIAATTGRELSGYTTVRAGIDGCANTWLTPLGPVSDFVPLIKIEAEMPASLTDGSEFQWCKLLEVIEGNSIAWNDTATWQKAGRFAEQVREHVEQMHELQQSSADRPGPGFEDLLGMAAGLYNGAPLNQFSFKQFRDAGDPSNACYQALVRSQFVVDRVWDQQELEKRIHVNIIRRPTQPIVQALGLQVKSTHQREDGSTYDSLQPVRPFHLKADLRTLPGKNVTRRVHTLDWSPLSLPGWSPEGKMLAGRRIAHTLEHEPSRQLLKEDRLQKLMARGADDTALDERSARQLLGEVYEPQMVINNILSKEWGHDGAPRWWRRNERGKLVGYLEAFITEIDGLENPTDEQRRQRKDAKLRRKYLTRFPVERLPDYVLRCDMAGTEQDAIFQRKERVGGEHDPEYWTPITSRRSVPRSIGDDSE